MEIIVTLEEVKEKCKDWKEFCKEEGWAANCVDAGYGDLSITLTKQKCFKYGLIDPYE